MIDRALDRIDDDYTQRKLDEMVRIDSVVGREGRLAEYLVRELSALGLRPETQEVEPGRPNVYARIGGDKPGKRLNFNGHMDTVPVVEGWDSDPFTPVRRGDHLVGLGACDMKAGLACILSMLKAIRDSGHRMAGELSVSAVVDEEAHSKGSRAMMATDFGKVDAIVLAEPYPGDESKPIPLGITGKLLYDVHVHGKAAHAFRPQLGVNAVEDAARIIASLEGLSFLEHPDFHTGNHSTLMFEGGYEIYSVVVPASARFEVNRLLVPGETVQTAVADLERLIDGLRLKSSVEVKTKPPYYEPFSMRRDEPILTVFDTAYRAVMGRPPVYEHSYGITDANVFAGEGAIPCLHLGPGRGTSDPRTGGGPHEKNEYVDVTWLPRVVRMYVLIADAFLNG
jgi:acetylornithine deacetylase/succinyl-diaminopimelate desuccinylase-like protein